MDDINEIINDKRSLKERAESIVGYKVRLILDGNVEPEDIINLVEERELTELLASYGDKKEILLIYQAMPDKNDFEMLNMIKGIKSIDKGGDIYEVSPTNADIYKNDTYRITRNETGYKWEDKQGVPGRNLILTVI